MEGKGRENDEGIVAERRKKEGNRRENRESRDKREREKKVPGKVHLAAGRLDNKKAVTAWLWWCLGGCFAKQGSTRWTHKPQRQRKIQKEGRGQKKVTPRLEQQQDKNGIIAILHPHSVTDHRPPCAGWYVRAPPLSLISAHSRPSLSLFYLLPLCSASLPPCPPLCRCPDGFVTDLLAGI
jgi:hypothetical protein